MALASRLKCAFLYPSTTRQMTEPQFQPALPLADIPQGSMRPVTLGGREIVICHTKEGVYALDNICSHAHARMCEGRLRATRIVCPLHGASFDIRDGKVLGPPAVQPLPTFQVRVVDGTIEVAV
jgi:3-phenylpropionate/trans-cinnamate dioxygenase ferredoxin component